MTTDRSETSRVGTRFLVAAADQCRLCLAVDAVEEVLDNPGGTDGRALSNTPPNGRAIPIVEWRAIVGVSSDDAPRRSTIIVVRTPAGPVGLATDACLGIRSLTLALVPLIPTHLRDEAGEPLCVLLQADSGPYYLLDPRLLARASAELGPDIEPSLCLDSALLSDRIPETDSGMGEEPSPMTVE